jgi:hypothetical protein
MQKQLMNLLLAQLLLQVSKQVLMQTQQTGFLGYTSAAAGAVYSSSLGFARNIVVSPGQWTNIMGYYNDNGAPLYNAAQPIKCSRIM